MTRTRDVCRRLALLAVMLPLTAVSSGAQATAGAPIRLAWDANVEPVAGYKVHVGTRSGTYVQVIDVSSNTTFSYENTIRGQRYYFAVSAYLPDGTSSPLSTEISGTAGAGGSPIGPPTEPETPDDQTTARVSASESTDEAVAACADGSPCYDIAVVTSGLDTITALTDVNDGTLLFVERGQRVRVYREGAARPADVLAAAPGSRITDVVADSAFVLNRHVYLGLIRTHDDISNDFSVVRYRLVDDQMTEPAVVVTGLSMGQGAPRIATDAAGKVYVAMPGDRDAASFDPYAARILRFNRDGTVPTDSRAASPIFAYGLRSPTALDARGGLLWARGSDDRGFQPLMYVDLSAADDHQWPRMLASPAVLGRDVATTAVAYLDETQQLHVLEGLADVRGPIALRDSRGPMTPEALGTASIGRIAIAVRVADGSSSVLRLTRR